MSDTNRTATDAPSSIPRRRLLLARVLLAGGLVVGLASWGGTVSHIGDPRYVLLPGFSEGATHAWYHAFREACGDVAQMIVFLIAFFAPPRFRTPETWLLLLILMIGYYAPFWIGEPFLPELSDANPIARLVHVVMALLSVLALFVARPAFHAGTGLRR